MTGAHPVVREEPRAASGWLAVELRHLAALAAVHEERSFRGAADRLGYVQSAVSQQVAQLERLVGTRLVHRTRGHGPPVTLTDAGLVLLEHEADIRAQLDAARAGLEALGDADQGRLHVGAVPGAASGLLAEVREILRGVAPDLVLEVRESERDDALLAAVRRGELDAAVAEVGPRDADLERVAVLEEPCVLLVPAGSVWASRPAPAELRDLARMPLVRVDGWEPLDALEERLRAEGLAMPVAVRADAVATVQALVGAGCGVAILPRLAVRPGDGAVVVHELGALLPSRRLSLCWRPTRQDLRALEQLREAAVAAGAMRAGAAPVRDR